MLNSSKEFIHSCVEVKYQEELNSFLFSLGCYSGEEITVIQHIKGGSIVVIKDARYSIDSALAKAIIVDNK